MSSVITQRLSEDGANDQNHNLYHNIRFSESLSQESKMSADSTAVKSHHKPLYSLCFLLAFQVRKFIGLFEVLKQDTGIDKTLLPQIEKSISRFGKHFHTNYQKLNLIETGLDSSNRFKFGNCFGDLNRLLVQLGVGGPKDSRGLSLDY
jgi:hypothetical protein